MKDAHDPLAQRAAPRKAPATAIAATPVESMRDDAPFPLPDPPWFPVLVLPGAVPEVVPLPPVPPGAPVFPVGEPPGAEPGVAARALACR